ncbi:MAG TPA: hypothetical protein VFI84_03010 [Candidatus Saccharimonadales bacterium]|nr:hypothetical protein [Candidatus Saccharimonadales bacterium]
MPEKYATILPFRKDEPLEVMPTLPKLDYASRVLLELATDCRPCSIKRIKLLGENAILWEQRFGTENTDAARQLLFERVICGHVSDNSDLDAQVAARVAELIAKPREEVVQLP